MSLDCTQRPGYDDRKEVKFKLENGNLPWWWDSCPRELEETRHARRKRLERRQRVGGVNVDMAEAGSTTANLWETARLHWSLKWCVLMTNLLKVNIQVMRCTSLRSNGAYYWHTDIQVMRRVGMVHINVLSSVQLWWWPRANSTHTGTFIECLALERQVAFARRHEKYMES